VADLAPIAVEGALVVGALALLGASLWVRDSTRAVASFAVGSALLSGAFFVFGAPFAGVFELTVGSGLTAVLFLVAFTLTATPRGREPTGGGPP
jgi:uncharacterized MnhB-related membrane protein